MNVYFACAITGGRDFEAIYQILVQALVEDGHVVPTAHLAKPGVIAAEAILEPQEVYTRDAGWIRECDVLVAEVSVPSHGVGYEVGFALSLGKRVLALYQEGRKISKMLNGNPDPLLSVQCYTTPETAVLQIRKFLNTDPLYL